MTRLALVVAAAACAGEAGDPPQDTSTTTSSTTPPLDPSDPDPRFGGYEGEFVVQDFGYVASFQGAVADRPPLRFHVEAERSGQCRLLTYTPSVCEPACAPPTEACVDGRCEAWPVRAGAGDLTLTTGSLEVTSSEDPLSGYYMELPAPITGGLALEAAGGEVPAFSLALEDAGLELIEPRGGWDGLLQRRAPGEDAVLTWRSPDPTARVAVRMTTGVGTHGGIAHAEIDCEGPDVGRLVLPGPYLDLLYAEGWGCGECGVNDLHRLREAVTEVEGRSVRLVSRVTTRFFHRP